MDTQEHRPRKLTRSSSDRALGGVAGGLGAYFDVDPVLFRIAAVALVVLGGAGILLYLAAWVLIPSDGAAEPGARRFSSDSARRAGLLLLVLVASGVLLVAGIALAGFGGGVAAGLTILAAGGALVLAGVRGWGVRWLILPALALTIPAAATAAADVDLHGGFGDRTYRPAAASDIRDSYRIGGGRLVVDLRGASLPAGDQPLKVRVGAGEAIVLVPRDVCVTTTARVGAGEAQSFDHGSGGVDVDWDDTPRAPAGHARIRLDADVGVGRVAVAHRLSDVEHQGDWRGPHDVGIDDANSGCVGSGA
jgi:phage shock protein PspC (stress-responsive transcriptional regulator)